MLNIALFSPRELTNYFRQKFKNLSLCNVVFVFEDTNSDTKSDEYCFDLKHDYDYKFLRELKVEVVLVYGWNYLVPESVLNNFEFYNLHASMLPQYRGPLPILFQLLNNESTIGVTLHKMSKSFDTGDIYKQEEFSIADSKDYLSISTKVLKTSAKLINSFISDYISQKVVLTPQDHSQATYYSKRELDKYIVDSTFTYPEFCKLETIFKHYFPFRVLIDSQIYEVKSFDLKPTSGSEKFALRDKTIYLQISSCEHI